MTGATTDGPPGLVVEKDESMAMGLPRRHALKLFAQLGVGVVLAGCGPAQRPDSARAVPPTSPPTSLDFNPVLANSELVKGRNRIALGLIGENGRPITDAQVTLGFFQIEGQIGTKRGETAAPFRWIEFESKGLYVATAEFDAVGRWGLEAAVTRPGRGTQVARIPLDVREKGSAPMIGSPAPGSRTAVAQEAPDPAELCSTAPPCDLHAISLDQAFVSGKPSVVLFASPGFCISATCAPQLGVVQQVRSLDPTRASFVHVEVYKDPRNQVVADTVTEWGLVSEPWVFVVDRAGIVADRYEAMVTPDELTSAVQRLG